jgi:hypothetical protein
MRRILRNYLISFAIIALFAAAITLIDRWADKKESLTNSAGKTAPGAEPISPTAQAPNASASGAAK